MQAIARWCYRHRFAVIVAWVALLIGLGAMSQAVATTYDNSLILPGTGSGEAQTLLQKSAPAQAGDSDQIVWQVDQGKVTDPAVQQRISAMLSEVSRVPEVTSVVSPYQPGNELQISADGRTAFATVTFAKAADDLEGDNVKQVITTATDAAQPGLAVELGGKAISSAEQKPESVASLIGLIAAAVILLIAFGSLLSAALPIVTAIAGVGSAMMLMAPLSHMMSVNAIAPILGTLIGLGVGIDYALFILTRHRQALMSGLDPEEAAVQALNTSGRAVLFAGGTVCIALLGLLTIGVDFVTGLAVPSAITVVCTVIAAITLMPALFGILGMRVLSRKQRRTLVAGESLTTAPSSTGLWARWSHFIPRYPALLAALGVAVMLVVSAPVLDLRLGFADASNDDPSTHTYKSYQLLAEGFGPGFNGPLFLVAETRSPADREALSQLGTALAAVPGVAAVQGPPPQTAADSGPAIQMMQVIPTTAPQSEDTANLITDLRDTVIPRYTQGNTLEVHVGGFTATFVDFAEMTSSKLPWLLLTIVGLSFLLLVLAFRSLLIPAVTAVLNLLASAAAFGILTAFFQWGWGTRLFGLGEPSPIQGYLPELVLAVLFGLSMDYQVFLVSRMAEEWARTRDNTQAVMAGLTQTARVITTAALIMIAVFVAFMFLGDRAISQFGIGLAAAVALDAFILRTVLVPAVMYMCGRANWWLPSWVDRRLPHLAIEPSDEARSAPALI
ncbi:MMPL family transporter [Micromonospora sp. NPDC005686]|uniref:MMPL family transporter n=1 Tax=unclassified Micromonospora TaxID=2617518 RepID=UPI0033B65F05